MTGILALAGAIIVVVLIVLFFAINLANKGDDVEPTTPAHEEDVTKPPAPAALTPPPATAGAQTYTNGELGLTLQYPAAWKTVDHPAPGAVVGIGEPTTGPNDTFSENIILGASDLSGSPLSTVTDIIDSYWKRSAAELTDAVLLNRRSTTMAGEPAEEIVYTASNGDLRAKGLAIAFIKNKTAFIFSFTAEETNFESYLPTAQAILDSVRVN